MRLKPKLALVFLALLLSLPAFAETEKLIFAADVIRHGDRTPIRPLSKATYAWPQGPGQLTPTGMQQEYQLGLVMHKRYIEESALLPKHYEAQTLYLRSSDLDRTLMSAESLLMGLYPLGTGPLLPQSEKTALPSGYQPIPIHTIPRTQDQLLIADSNPQKFQSWLEKYVYPRSDWKKKTAILKPQFTRWSQLTGRKITKLEQLISIADTLYIQQLYHQPLPPGMTEQDAKTLIEAGHWAFINLFKSPSMGRVTGLPLLSQITAHLKQASLEQTKLKFVLYSGHDSTILSLMSAMGIPMDTQPPYASNLNFSLYRTATGENIVKISLNGKNLLLPACGLTVCKLSQFENLSHLK